MLWRRSKVSLPEAALAYAALGIPVFPCHWPTASSPRRSATAGCSCQLLACSFPGEHPLVPDWMRAATTDPAQILAWWRRCPRANVGVLTGVAFDVVDVPGELAERAASTAMPKGPLADTGTGRRHYFVAPSGRGNTALPMASGTRQRLYRHGRGGYVLAAPSRHVSGAVTQWLRPLTAPVPDAPPHALAAMAGAGEQPA
jgi:Bifunctional DNA primase/polymerase, N-terminal